MECLVCFEPAHKMIACRTCDKSVCVVCLRNMPHIECPFCKAFHREAYLLKRARWAKKILLYYGADIRKFVRERGEACKIEADGGSLCLDDVIDHMMSREGHRVYEHYRREIHQYM